MLTRLFPRQIDNRYLGYWPALWLLVPLVFFKGFMGFNVMGLNPLVDRRSILSGPDAIPIDSFGEVAQSVVLFLFSAWGLQLFILCLLGVLVLLRYRAMIPLMFLLLTIEQLGRKGLSTFSPILRPEQATEVATGTYINWAFNILLLVGLLLSVMKRPAAAARPTGQGTAAP